MRTRRSIRPIDCEEDEIGSSGVAGKFLNIEYSRPRENGPGDIDLKMQGAVRRDFRTTVSPLGQLQNHTSTSRPDEERDVFVKMRYGYSNCDVQNKFPFIVSGNSCREKQFSNETDLDELLDYKLFSPESSLSAEKVFQHFERGNKQDLVSFEQIRSQKEQDAPFASGNLDTDLH